MLLGTISLSTAYWAYATLTLPLLSVAMAVGLFLWWVGLDVARKRVAL